MEARGTTRSAVNAKALLEGPYAPYHGRVEIIEIADITQDGAFDQAESTLGTVLSKAEFWNIHRDTELNKRQKMMINRLLDEFFGKLNSSKWAKLTKTSQDTASRDIDDLVQKGILLRGSAGGRSTSYELVLPKGKEVAI